MKATFPFRLGTTSYIVPADLKANVAALASRIDDIEVVLFESEEISNLPDAHTLQVMHNASRQSGLSYTIHFPLDVFLGSDDEVVRERSVRQCLRIVEMMEPLQPFGYVLHLPVGAIEEKAPAHPENWQRHVRNGVKRLLQTGLDSRRLCVETLSYPFEVAFGVVEEFNLSVCLDVGHVLLNGYSFNEYMRRYFSRARIIHLHGICEGRDHQSIAYLPGEVLDSLMAQLFTATPGTVVLTLEIFNESDLNSSLLRLKEYAP